MVISAKHVWTSIAVVLLLVLQYRLWFDDSGVIASRALERQIQTMTSSNEAQAEVNQGLLSEVMELRSGNALVEEAAREQLGLVKEGETFILFAEPDNE
ncbi:MAG: septum formation initiator family protein [Pseudomonadota bacterium]|nr:septum formation initiator family protein [Pseudomonadota bacterium]